MPNDDRNTLDVLKAELEFCDQRVAMADRPGSPGARVWFLPIRQLA